MDNHTNCIIDIVEELMERNFSCYLEQPLCKGIVADIYAKRNNEEIIVEVGTCSHTIAKYKKAKPNAKIVFAHQLKNYGVNGTTIYWFPLIAKNQRQIEKELSKGYNWIEHLNRREIK